MSTRSCIIVKVRPSQAGQVVKFNEKNLPVAQEAWEFKDLNGEFFRSEVDEDKAKEVELKEKYIGIYCHSDGYPSGVGKVLKDLFNNYENALNLVVGGDCSFVWFDGVRRYATREGEEWKYLQPKQGKTPKTICNKMLGIEYCYLFDEENGEWLMSDMYAGKGKFKAYTGTEE